jgi:hypothetical protein
MVYDPALVGEKITGMDLEQFGNQILAYVIEFEIETLINQPRKTNFVLFNADIS